MTQVIHGLTREQLLAQVFNKSLVAGAVTTIIVKGLNQSDSRSDKGGKSKTKGGF
ncbi:hypothetical protein [Pantoea sp.]|uniref:hypothetical protein n=1 Tax=Pantoea sp. TaxID=69393 RepID=UPI0031DF34B8